MKTVFIDIDGTLFNSKRELPLKNFKALTALKKLGIRCFLISGRPRHKTMSIAKEANAGCYIISSTGSDIYDYENDSVIFQSSLDNDSVKSIYKLAHKNNVTIDLVCGFTIYTNGKLTSPYKKEIPHNNENFFDKIKVSQILIEDKDYDKVFSLKKIVEKKFKKVKIVNQTKAFYDSNFTRENVSTAYFDINSPNINKGSAIIFLCKELDINLKDTICIGDSMNDLSMFEVAGKSIAMGNSVQAIKQAADEIILSNDEDGVANFLIKEFDLKI